MTITKDRMGTRCLRFGAGVLAGTGLLLTSGCLNHNGSGIAVNNGGQSNRIKAAQWVRDSTAIDSYEVDVPNDGLSATLRLYDQAGNKLNTLVITQDSGGAFRTVMRQSGATVLTMVTSGIENDAGYDTLINLTNGNGDQVDMQASNHFGTCYDPSVLDLPGPACTSPIPLAKNAYSMPSCGAIQPRLQDQGVTAPLQSLRYSVPRPPQPPAIGGQLWQGPNLTASTLSVYDANGLTDEGTVSQWLAATGADAIIGTPEERRLTGAYLDLTWRRVAQQRLATNTGASQRTRSVFAGPPGQNQVVRVHAPPGSAQCGTAAQGSGRAALCFGNNWFQVNLFPGLSGLWGDPHVTSTDDATYDFQGAGEYVLARAIAGDPFELQGRLEPLDGISSCRNVTFVTAAAMNIDGTRVGVYAGDPVVVRVNGQSIDPDDASAIAAALPAGTGFERTTSGNYSFTWPDGLEQVYVTTGTNVLAIKMALASSRRTQIAGVLGYYNDDSSDDLRARDGSTLPIPAAFDDFYSQFGDSWRVTDSTSLFDYAPGKGTDDYTIPGRPTEPVAVNTLTAAQRSQGEAACKDIEGQPEHDWCVIDVGCSGIPSLKLVYKNVPRTNTRLHDRLQLRDDPVFDTPDSIAADSRYNPGTSCLLPRPWPVYVIREQSGTTLMQPAMVDADAPGSYSGADSFSGQPVPATTKADVYFLHMPDGPAGNAASGSLTFDHDILGVAVTPTNLDAGDGTYGDSGLDYPTGNADRGLAGTDHFQISSDRRTLSLQWQAGDGVDQMRVFVKAD